MCSVTSGGDCCTVRVTATAETTNGTTFHLKTTAVEIAVFHRHRERAVLSVILAILHVAVTLHCYHRAGLVHYESFAPILGADVTCEVGRSYS